MYRLVVFALYTYSTRYLSVFGISCFHCLYGLTLIEEATEGSLNVQLYMCILNTDGQDVQLSTCTLQKKKRQKMNDKMFLVWYTCPFSPSKRSSLSLLFSTGEGHDVQMSTCPFQN